MQASTLSITPAASKADLPVSGPRELHIDELALVGGGLPKGGWQAATGASLQAEASASMEPLPKGGWAA